jgi:hypothetical protein
MGHLLIKENEIKNIKKMYGVLTESKYYFSGDMGYTDKSGKPVQIYISNDGGNWRVWKTDPKNSNFVELTKYKVPKIDELGWIHTPNEDKKFVLNNAATNGKAIVAELFTPAELDATGYPLMFIDKDGTPKMGVIGARNAGGIPFRAYPEATMDESNKVKLTKKKNTEIKMHNYFVTKDRQGKRQAYAPFIIRKKSADKVEE